MFCLELPPSIHPTIIVIIINTAFITTAPSHPQLLLHYVLSGTASPSISISTNYIHQNNLTHTHTHLDHHIPSTSTINIIIIVIITNFYLHIHQLNQPKHLKIVWQRFHPNALQCSAPFEVSLKVVVLGRILPAAVVKVMSRYIPPDIEQEANQYKFSAISLILECECVGFHSKENTKHVATDLQTFHVLLLFKFNQF